MDISQLSEVIPGIIIFRISGLDFCINVKDVYVIKRTEEFERLRNNGSNGTAYVKLFNINIPIIDLAKSFNLADEKNSSRRMILIIKHPGEEDDLEKTFGILVDEVVEFIATDKKADSYLLKFIPSGENPFLSGSIFIGDRKILLPNFSKIAANLFLNSNVQ